MNILVAGIGNIFMGDDGFGVEVVRRLAQRTLPDGVKVVDFGTRGLDLTYALLDPWKAAIFIDAAPRGKKPGTVYVLEPDAPKAMPLPEMHNLDPVRVLQTARSMGASLTTVRVVGCEPLRWVTDDEELTDQLSEPVAKAVDEAATLVERLLKELAAHA